MRYLFFSVVIQIGIIAHGFCQPLELKKSAISPMEPIVLNWFEGETVLNVNQQRMVSDGMTIATGSGATKSLLAKEERLVYSHEGVVYKIRHLHGYLNEFVKEKNGKILQRVEIGIESSPKVLDPEGRFVIFDIVDGTATRGVFYSPEFKAINSYSPKFGNSFDVHIGLSNSIVCVASEDWRSKRNKLAILSRQGALITEKQFEIPGFTLSSLNVSGNIIVTYHSQTTASGRPYLTCYDAGLKVIWYKELLYRVMNNRVSLSKDQNMVFATWTGVYCMDAMSGLELWKHSNEGVGKATFMEPMFILNDEYVVVASCSYEANELRNNKLTLLSAKDGTVLKVEELGTTLKLLVMIPEKDGFILIKDSEYIRYTR